MLQNLISPKVLYPIFVLLIAIVYFMGRRDGAAPIQSEFDTYRNNTEKVVKYSQDLKKKNEALEKIRLELVEQNKILKAKDKELETRYSRLSNDVGILNNRLDELLRGLPDDSLAPNVCRPWVDAINACKLVRDSLTAKVALAEDRIKNKDEQITNKTEENTNLTTQNENNKIRADSLQTVIAGVPKIRECKLLYWFGPKCPSRITTGFIGATLGFIGGIVVKMYLPF